MSTTLPTVPQGAVPLINAPGDSMDIPRLVYCAPYFTTVPLAELIEPSVQESVEGMLPSLVPPYVNDAANAAVSQLAVLLTGSTMTGPLYLNPVMPTQSAQAASMAYVDSMIATAGIPEVPAVPSGQTWARQTGQWVPISEAEGTFLPLGGGTMQGSIDMSGNAVNNLPAVPTLPNGAAPAQWVLNQLASVSLYQGTWDADTNTPDLTQPGTHQNGFTWIALTASDTGVVISQPIPGLQGLTIYNGDTIIYSALNGTFSSIHAGGLSLSEADGRYVQLAGSQMSGALLLNSNATNAMAAVPLQQVQSLVAGAGLGEPPADGQAYGRVGVGAGSWVPTLPIAGGILTGALTLAGNATANLNPIPLQQLTTSLASYVPLAGGVTMTGALTMGSAATLTLNANAAAPLQAVPFQQLTATLGAYLTSAAAASTYLALAGGTMTGQLNGTSMALTGNASVGGTLTPTGGIVGVINGSNAAAGDVGEYQQVTQASTSVPTGGTAFNILAIALPAGDWDVWGNILYSLPASGVTSVQSWINTTSVAAPAQPAPAFNVISATGLTGAMFLPTGTVRLSVSATTNVFLSGVLAGSGAATASGIICARRVR